MLGVLGIFKAKGTKVFNDVMSRPSEIVGGSVTSLLPIKCLLDSQSYGPFFLNMLLPFAILAVAGIILIPKTMIEKILRKGRKTKEDPVFKGKFNIPRFLAKCKCLRAPMTVKDVSDWRARFRPFNRLSGVLVFTFFTLYPTLVASVVSIFNCTEPIEGKRTYTHCWGLSSSFSSPTSFVLIFQVTSSLILQ